MSSFIPVPDRESVHASGAAQAQRAEAERSKAEAARQRRERIATAALQAVITAQESTNPATVAEYAVQYADALIAELDRESPR